MSEPCHQEKRITVHGMEIDVLRDALKENVGCMRKDFEDHVKSGMAWRIAVAGTAAVLLVQLGTAVYFYGRLVAIVDNHDRNIARLETKVLK